MENLDVDIPINGRIFFSFWSIESDESLHHILMDLWCLKFINFSTGDTIKNRERIQNGIQI